MEIITVSVQKGGVGKTTTAAVLAQAAAHKGKRVLAIDLEPQGNLTFSLNGSTAAAFSSYDLLMGDQGEPQRTSQGIDLYPASQSLAVVTSEKGSARRLQKALEPLKEKYDLIIIDTMPTVGELQFNALQAATGLVIPLEVDTYNLQSLYQTIDTAEHIKKSNPALEIKGLILTKFDARSTFTRQMQESIIFAANKKGIPYLGSVRHGIAVREAAALQESLFDYAPKSNPAKDYMEIYKHIVE